MYNLKAEFLEVLLLAAVLVNGDFQFWVHVEHHLPQLLNACMCQLFPHAAEHNSNSNSNKININLFAYLLTINLYEVLSSASHLWYPIQTAWHKRFLPRDARHPRY